MSLVAYHWPCTAMAVAYCEALERQIFVNGTANAYAVAEIEPEFNETCTAHRTKRIMVFRVKSAEIGRSNAMRADAG